VHFAADASRPDEAQKSDYMYEWLKTVSQLQTKARVIYERIVHTGSNVLRGPLTPGAVRLCLEHASMAKGFCQPWFVCASTATR
jgi:hypothetical protein